MKRILLISCLSCLIALNILKANAQNNIIHLYTGKAPGSEHWLQKEKVFFDSAGSKEHFIYNVADPTLTVLIPDSVAPNGTAVVICPGGAFHVLGIDNEGYNVAHFLNSLGITAFVLKYRLACSRTQNPLQELGAKMQDFKALDKENDTIVPLAIDDAKTALRYVKQHAAEYHLDSSKIGVLGFSAGGTVTAGVAFGYNAGSRPAFAAPVYAYLGALKNFDVPADAPPLFVAACTDDDLGFAPHSVQMYNYWLAAKKKAELHIYSKGGHGFGMKIQNLPVDGWRWLFRDWLKEKGFL